MGESVAEATIIKWLKKEGDAVKADEPIIEIATDKVDSEVPSPEDGVRVKCAVKEGDVVQVGQLIAVIQSGSASAPEPVVAAATPAVTVSAEPAAVPYTPSSEPVTLVSNSESTRFYSPLVRNIAKNEHISMQELDSIKGNGQGGRVTKEDLMQYLQHRSAAPAPAASPAPATTSAPSQPAMAAAPAPVKAAAPAEPAPKAKSNIVVGPNDEIVEMDRMRKLIADHMVMSKAVSPHVTSMVEIDVTNMVQWRDKVKKDFEKREGEKITFTPIILEAVARAIKDYPMINVSVNGTQIIKRKSINLGMATALPSGNLIVPVIKNADMLSLVGLTKSVNDLANRARANKLTPDDISGGTFTVTNVGSFGNVMGTPIINQPQVAIMAVGVIKKKPAVLETPQGDVIAIRQMMFCSLSYDHRVVDGSLGGSFLRRVADYLEAFDPNRSL